MKDTKKEVDALISLISNQQALIIGPIRQEILSGYSDKKKYNQLREKQSYFENTPILDEDYESAAKLCNTCRKKGVKGSHIDFLICAVAKRLEISIFTTDRDFSLYQKVIGLKLFL